MIFFWTDSAAFHSQMVFRFSRFLSLNSCGTHFPIFWIFFIVLNEWTFNWSASSCCVCQSSSSNKASNSFVFKFIWRFPTLFVLHIKSTTFAPIFAILLHLCKNMHLKRCEILLTAFYKDNSLWIWKHWNWHWIRKQNKDFLRINLIIFNWFDELDNDVSI